MFLGGSFPRGLAPPDPEIPSKQQLHLGDCDRNISSEEHILRGEIGGHNFDLFAIFSCASNFCNIVKWVSGYIIYVYFRGFTSHQGISVPNVRLKVSVKLHSIRYAVFLCWPLGCDRLFLKCLLMAIIFPIRIALTLWQNTLVVLRQTNPCTLYCCQMETLQSKEILRYIWIFLYYVLKVVLL